MTLTPLFQRFQEKLVAFADDRRAVSAVEFALLAPLMITLYLGGVEVTQAVTADRKTTLVAHTVADLIAQERGSPPDITDSEMNDVFNATNAVAAPLRTANLKVVVSSVCVDATGVAKIKWSDPPGTHSVGDVVAVPAALKEADKATPLIWGEATYTYKPAIGYVITGQLTLRDHIFIKPRTGSAIMRNGSGTCT
jgi:Flp pilus assembly protein TadG